MIAPSKYVTIEKGGREMRTTDPAQIPVIDVHSLVAGTEGRDAVAAQIRRACEESGFFYIVGHGVDEALQQRLEESSRRFFALEPEAKLRIGMAHGGRAWRGYFP